MRQKYNTWNLSISMDDRTEMDKTAGRVIFVEKIKTK